MEAEKRVAEGAWNNAKIVIPNGEKDESTSVDNEVEFETPPAEVVL